MSGGIDSSVTILMLHEQGYQVIGAHMKLWDFAEVGGEAKKDGRCCTLESIDDCREVCDSIGAPFYVLNFVDQFRDTVIENFVSEYRAGRTPNPCVLCNSEIKWEGFLKRALELGCDYIATGHYSQIRKNEDTGRYYIEKGIDHTRDQSYALWGLSQNALSKTLMPLGALKKSEVRQLARDYKIARPDRPESHEICFVADDNYHRFLREWEAKRGRNFTPGEIVDEDGAKIGEHEGVEFYTLGQRRGLGITARKPVYVKEIDPAGARIVVGSSASLMSKTAEVGLVNWIALADPSEPFSAEVKIRYLSRPARATVSPLPGSRARVEFDEPQRSITPGQSIVFYDNTIALGGGLIERLI